MSKKISELTTASALSGSELLELVQSSTNKKQTTQQILVESLAVTASGTNTYTATLSPSISAYTTNHKYFVKFTNANSGASTLNLNGIGAIDIKKSGSTALSSGDISAGQILELIFDGTNFQIIGGPTNQYLASGTYTPTLTNVTNVAASTAYVSQWLRVGNVVTVSGKVDIDATLAANSATELGISLPIASALTAEEQVGGDAVSDSVASLSARIRADATNDRASVVFKAISLTNDSYSFQFTYLIL